MKALKEKRNALLNEMDSILKKVESEERAFDETETARYAEIKTEIGKIDATLKASEEARAMEPMKIIPKSNEPTAEQTEERAFSDFIRGVVSEERADVTKSANTAIIPSTIANKIIKKVVDISPIYQLATKYNVKGDLSIPYYDETTDKITVEYADEFTDPTAHGGKFASISLTGFLARALCKISKSLINNAQFDVVGFVINDMADNFARWIEKEVLNGTTDKIDGLKGVTQNITTASATAVTTDELIDVQEEIPDLYQGGAIWIMSKATRTAIRKLKDSDGNYILNKDATARWGYTLLGKDVYTSANMSGMVAGKTSVYYGDMSGLAIKLSEEINIEVLREKYAEQHVIGVLGFAEIDAKVENAQMISKLTMKSA